MFIKKHHNYKYIIARLKQISYFKKFPDNPWMTNDSINLLDQLIKKIDVGLEYGSGRSTLWFAERCKHLTSIEHNKEWFEIISEKIKGQNNIDYRLLSVNENPTESDYYKSIYNFTDESFDFIINDGKYRDIIASEGIKKIKFGGLYILDNAERYLQNNFNLPAPMVSDWDTSLHWKVFNEICNDWRKIWTTDGVSSTLIMIKTK